MGLHECILAVHLNVFQSINYTHNFSFNLLKSIKAQCFDFRLGLRSARFSSVFTKTVTKLKLSVSVSILTEKNWFSFDQNRYRCRTRISLYENNVATFW
jgi:hypothetical protein